MNHSGDRHHVQARRWYRATLIERLNLLTTTAILAEIGDGFAGRGRWYIADQFLRAALRDPRLEIVAGDRDVVDRAVQFRGQRPDKDWSLTDCISFVIMAERGVTAAFSADDDFRQAGFRALLHEPVENARAL